MRDLSDELGYRAPDGGKLRIAGLVAVDVDVGGSEATWRAPSAEGVERRAGVETYGSSTPTVDASVARRRMSLVLTKAPSSSLLLFDATSLLVCGCAVHTKAAAVDAALVEASTRRPGIQAAVSTLMSVEADAAFSESTDALAAAQAVPVADNDLRPVALLGAMDDIVDILCEVRIGRVNVPPSPNHIFTHPTTSWCCVRPVTRPQATLGGSSLVSKSGQNATSKVLLVWPPFVAQHPGHRPPGWHPGMR